MTVGKRRGWLLNKFHGNGNRNKKKVRCLVVSATKESRTSVLIWGVEHNSNVNNGELLFEGSERESSIKWAEETRGSGQYVKWNIRWHCGMRLDDFGSIQWGNEKGVWRYDQNWNSVDVYALWWMSAPDRIGVLAAVRSSTAARKLVCSRLVVVEVHITHPIVPSRLRGCHWRISLANFMVFLSRSLKSRSFWSTWG